MVLTNFECWAHGGGDPSSAAAAGFETGNLRTHLDPFNPRAVGFISDANNNNSSSDHNNSNMDGQPTPEVLPLEVLRCKKRLNPHGDCGAGGGGGDVDQPMYTKRCRYDDADLAAQYCNDFFSMPATQIIGTQACLMDYEMQANGGGMMMESEPTFPHQQQQQQQQQQHQQPQQHQRIYQHYQESAERRAAAPPSKIKRSNDPLEKIQLNTISNSSSSSEAVADLYIATHGGCLHHFSRLSGGGGGGGPEEQPEESDI